MNKPQERSYCIHHREQTLVSCASGEKVEKLDQCGYILYQDVRRKYRYGGYASKNAGWCVKMHRDAEKNAHYFVEVLHDDLEVADFTAGTDQSGVANLF
jgi:hypothetical protein